MAKWKVRIAKSPYEVIVEADLMHFFGSGVLAFTNGPPGMPVEEQGLPGKALVVAFSVNHWLNVERID